MTQTVKTVSLDDERPFADMPMDVLLALLMAIQTEAIHRLGEDMPPSYEKN